MTINEFKTLKLTPAVAYILGIFFPKFKIFRTKTNRNIILGSISYNPQPNKTPHKCITAEQLTTHWNRVYNFLETLPDLRQSLLHNNSELFKGAKLKKWGFSFYLEIDSTQSPNDVKLILSAMVKRVLDSQNREIQRCFLRGCFDGRSSVDENSGLLALDTSLNSNDLCLLDRIADIFCLYRSNNSRNIKDPRAFQYRIKKESLRNFINNIGFFSERRKIDLVDYLNNIGR